MGSYLEKVRSLKAYIKVHWNKIDLNPKLFKKKVVYSVIKQESRQDIETIGKKC